MTQRAPQGALPKYRRTGRDIDILKAALVYRALTTGQFERLLFPSAPGQNRHTRRTRCPLRLKLMFHHALLYRVEQPQLPSQGRKPLIYFLDERGAQLLADLMGVEREELDWQPHHNEVSSPFLEHLLACNDFRIAATLAAQQKGWRIVKWLDDRVLRSTQMKDIVEIVGPEGRKQRAAVVPDAYFLLNTDEYIYHHFVEIDRRTVTGEASQWGRRDWARKVRALLAYYHSGKYQERYQAKGLRILTVTTGERRLAHLKAITEKVGGKKLFWFTTADKVTPDSVLTEKIWQIASEGGLHALTW